MELLYRIPVGVIRVYGRMLVKLQAQESMRWADRIGVGTGSLTAKASREIRRSWKADARLGESTKGATASPSQLSAMGIGYRQVPAVKKG